MQDISGIYDLEPELQHVWLPSFIFIFYFSRSKKLSVPASVVSRIMGRGGCNITAIQDVTGAHIDVDKQKDKNGERMITIR